MSTLYSPPSKPTLLPGFPISVSCSSIFLSAQADMLKTVQDVLVSFTPWFGPSCIYTVGSFCDILLTHYSPRQGQRLPPLPLSTHNHFPQSNQSDPPCKMCIKSTNILLRLPKGFTVLSERKPVLRTQKTTHYKPHTSLTCLLYNWLFPWLLSCLLSSFPLHPLLPCPPPSTSFQQGFAVYFWLVSNSLSSCLSLRGPGLQEHVIISTSSLPYFAFLLITIFKQAPPRGSWAVNIRY